MESMHEQFLLTWTDKGVYQPMKLSLAIDEPMVRQPFVHSHPTDALVPHSYICFYGARHSLKSIERIQEERGWGINLS